MKTFLLIFIMTAAHLSVSQAQTIRVLVWDEQQEQQAAAYENFIGNEIAARLDAASDDIEVRSVNQNGPEQGLTEEDLDWADIMIWWGHVRQAEITPELAQQKLIHRLKSGGLDMIFLHSAHWSTPFKEAMNERTMSDAHRKYPASQVGKAVEFEFIRPPGRMVPTRDSLVTPAYLALKRGNQVERVRVDLPNCCFPAYRPDGAPSTLNVMLSEHPIAKGLPKSVSMRSTEMYNEPFHVPEPDELIFEETWETGERFRSGMLWKVGEGTVFYFRPGHETFPVYKQPEVIRILENACRALGEN